MRKALVRSLDRHHGVPRLVLIALVQSMDGERAELVRPELEERDCLIDAAEETRRLSGDLHNDAGRAPLRVQHLTRALEISIGVEPLPNLLDRQLKQRGVETLPSTRHGTTRETSALAAAP